MINSIVTTEEGECLVPTIEHEGEWWLVALWRPWQTAGWSKPARIIALGELEPEPVIGNPKVGFVARRRVPKSLFSPEMSPEDRAAFRVEDSPQIEAVFLTGVEA
jgi:hypothetical protein